MGSSNSKQKAEIVRLRAELDEVKKTVATNHGPQILKTKTDVVEVQRELNNSIQKIRSDMDAREVATKATFEKNAFAIDTLFIGIGNLRNDMTAVREDIKFISEKINLKPRDSTIAPRLPIIPLEKSISTKAAVEELNWSNLPYRMIQPIIPIDIFSSEAVIVDNHLVKENVNELDAYRYSQSPAYLAYDKNATEFRDGRDFYSDVNKTARQTSGMAPNNNLNNTNNNNNNNTPPPAATFNSRPPITSPSASVNNNSNYNINNNSTNNNYNNKNNNNSNNNNATNNSNAPNNANSNFKTTNSNRSLASSGASSSMPYPSGRATEPSVDTLRVTIPIIGTEGVGLMLANSPPGHSDSGNGTGVEVSFARMLVKDFREMPGGRANPSKAAGVRVGDLVIEVNGKSATNAVGLIKMMQESRGQIQLTIQRPIDGGY